MSPGAPRTPIEWRPELVKEAVERGGRLLREAGSVGDAARLLMAAREEQHGNPLGGVLAADLQAALSPEHGGHLRAMAEKGAPSRRVAPRTRE
eukprot:4868012-Pyramimonas_sp.AAC.1